MPFRPFFRSARFRPALAALSMLAAPMVAASPVLAQGWSGAPFHAVASGTAAPGAAVPGTVRLADARRGLNVRAGPGTAYPRVGVLARGQGGRVATCDARGRWCALIFPNGGSGWVYMPLTRSAAVPASLGRPVDWRQRYRTDVPYIHTGQGRVNMRQGPGTHRTVVAQLNPGGGGFVQGCSADARWCLISVPPEGVEGWVSMHLLDPHLPHSVTAPVRTVAIPYRP